MTTLYLDADACPVRDEAYAVAARHGVPVVAVANATLRVPESVRLEVVLGFGAADDWIAAAVRPGDVCVTSDVPLAARVVAAGGVCVDPKGNVWDADTVGEALALRDLMTDLRAAGVAGGGPKPLTGKHRSGFKDMLDRTVVKAKRRG